MFGKHLWGKLVPFRTTSILSNTSRLNHTSTDAVSSLSKVASSFPIESAFKCTVNDPVNIFTIRTYSIRNDEIH
jgi:hypothetical protein